MSKTRSNNKEKTLLVVGWATTNSAVISGNPPLKFSAREIPASPGDGSGRLWLMVRVCILLLLFLFRAILITCHLHSCTNDCFPYALNLHFNLERCSDVDVPDYTSVTQITLLSYKTITSVVIFVQVDCDCNYN